MRLFLRALILFFAFICSLESRAQENSQFYELTKEACQVYLGDNPSNYISDTSHQYDNPLAATSIGQMILRNSFSGAYNDYSYFNREEVLVQVMKSPGFKKALDECYKDKALAKNYFVFFLNQLDLQGKTSSLYSEIGTFVGSGLFLVQFSKFVIQRAAWMERVFKWAGRVISVSIASAIVLSVGQSVYKTIREFNDGLGYEIKDALQEKTKEAEFYQELALGSIQSLEEQIISLKSEIKNAKTESEKNNLEKLLTESELLAKNLRQQIGEIQKKINPAEKK